MAEEVVVKEPLTQEMIAAGADFLRQLDEAHEPTVAALWLYRPESNRWRLMLALPGVERNGPRVFYKRIQSTLAKLPENHSRLSLQDITVVDAEYPLMTLLKKVVRTTDGISGVRMSGNVINGQFVDDVYIYRLK